VSGDGAGDGALGGGGQTGANGIGDRGGDTEYVDLEGDAGMNSLYELYCPRRYSFRPGGYQAVKRTPAATRWGALGRRGSRLAYAQCQAFRRMKREAFFIARPRGP